MALSLDAMREAADEQALVLRARDGDRAAFDELVRLHFARVYAFLHRLIGSHEDAEDLAQECFVRAWRSLPLYRSEAAFGTWVSRIALHLAQDHHRGAARRSRMQPLDDDPREPSRTSADSRAELARALANALARLPPRLRAALVLRTIEGRDYGEVAGITGVRPATARTHVMQARRMMMRWLAPWLPRDPGGAR